MMGGSTTDVMIILRNDERALGMTCDATNFEKTLAVMKFAKGELACDLLLEHSDSD